MLQSALQFESAAADILQIFAEQADRSIVRNLSAGFFDLLLVDQHFARENQSLRALARRGESAFDQKFVESEFHGCSVNLKLNSRVLGQLPDHESASTRSSAKC